MNGFLTVVIPTFDSESARYVFVSDGVPIKTFTPEEVERLCNSIVVTEDTGGD